jgi:hypothetical protein
MTVGIDREIEQEWIEWIRAHHIIDVLKTGLFADVKMYKVLHDEGEETVSYSIQYFAKSINDVNQYLQNFAPAIIEQHRKQFQNRHVAFQTLLEEM